MIVKRSFTVLSAICVCLTACQPKLKFDRVKWNTKTDLQQYPYRDAMIEDLVKHHQLKGLTYKQLTTQIGEPARYDSDLDNPYYDVIVDYGSDIDPVYTKVLSIRLNEDSIVTGYKVREWKKD
jgi:hypothetical protein